MNVRSSKNKPTMNIIALPWWSPRNKLSIQRIDILYRRNEIKNRSALRTSCRIVFKLLLGALEPLYPEEQYCDQ